MCWGLTACEAGGKSKDWNGACFMESDCPTTPVGKLLPMKFARAISLLCAIQGACSSFDELGERDLALDQSGGGPVQADLPRGTKHLMAPRYEQALVESGSVPDAVYAEGSTLIYMNRLGGTFTPGPNDSVQNRTTIAAETVSLPPASLSDSTWQAFMACVRQQFAPFNIEITDVDPGALPHYESVVAGSPTALGLPANVGGVSPFTSNCDVIPNSIVFTFADNLPEDGHVLCEVAAQEIAHSFGLDHEYLCSDPMTYLQGCGAKSFQDVAAPCGEDLPRPCRMEGQYDCGYQEQNSVELLTARIGLRPGDPIELSIAAPTDGAVVTPGFQVRVEAPTSVSMELFVDGAAQESLDSPPFVFSTPKLADGIHTIEIVASEGAMEARQSIAVEVDSSEGEPAESGDGGSAAEPGEPQERTMGQFVGGGCASSGGAADMLVLLLLGLAILAARRRPS